MEPSRQSFSYICCMKNIVATLLLAAICAAQEYGVMSVCTALDGKEYCYLYPEEYRVVKNDGTLVVASGLATVNKKNFHHFFPKLSEAYESSTSNKR